MSWQALHSSMQSCICLVMVMVGSCRLDVTLPTASGLSQASTSGQRSTKRAALTNSHVKGEGLRHGDDGENESGSELEKDADVRLLWGGGHPAGDREETCGSCGGGHRRGFLCRRTSGTVRAGLEPRS